MKNIGIYIHVPFCRYKCPYCDFYSVTVREELLDRYTAETLRRISALHEKKLAADTVYSAAEPRRFSAESASPESWRLLVRA